MRKSFDCTVCGSSVIDVLVRPFRLDEAVGPGATVEVDPIEIATGGIVSNSAIAMSRLGMNVAALGLLGDDPWAVLFREKLAKEGVVTEGLATRPAVQTTAAVVLIDEAGQRSFAFSPGATAEADRSLFFENLDLFRQSRMALVGYYGLLPKLEADLPEVLAAIRDCGCQTALDTAGDGGRLKPLDRALPHLDVYVPSLGEALHQTGETDPRTILSVYRSCGARGLVGMKLGSEGALLSPAPGEYVEIAPVSPPGAVIDTTGAGDAFYAGLLTGLLRGLPLRQSGRLAAAAGACSITAKGATAGLRSYEEMTKLAGVEG